MQKVPTIQQWVNHIPPPHTQSPNHVYFTPTPSGNIYYPQRQSSHNKYLSRDPSFHSDDGSHCSSVESLLESRKPDPEAVLLGLGFGPRRNSNSASRIPSRFLQPSKVLKSIDINKFIEQQEDLKQRDQRPSNPPSPAKLRPKSK